MPLGTLERSAPPLFQQGPSAPTRLLFFCALSIFLMVADVRFQVMQPVRATIGGVLYPVQIALWWPVQALGRGRDYAAGLVKARDAEAEARAALARQALRAERVELLEAENRRLRALLGLREALETPAVAAQVLYDSPDLYSRRLVIDRGSFDGIQAGAPVVNEAGVLGQVTRVYPFSAEVSLLADREAVMPVLNLRTQQRSVLYGVGGDAGGLLELRYQAPEADLQAGDVLGTSGVDGVFPAGLPVARIAAVERRPDAPFAHVTALPVADADRTRHLLVLRPVGVTPTPADAAAQAAAPAPDDARGPR